MWCGYWHFAHFWQQLGLRTVRLVILLSARHHRLVALVVIACALNQQDSELGSFLIFSTGAHGGAWPALVGLGLCCMEPLAAEERRSAWACLGRP